MSRIGQKRAALRGRRGVGCWFVQLAARLPPFLEEKTMNDLTQRLRLAALLGAAKPASILLTEAADEIERLRKSLHEIAGPASDPAPALENMIRAIVREEMEAGK